MSTTSPTSPTRTSNRTWWIVGTIGVAAMTALAIWFGIAATSGKVHWVNTGFDVISDEQIDIRFDLRRDSSQAVVCDLHALDEHHGRVGTGQVTVPPTDQSPSRHIEPLRTASRAVSGYVDTCTYADTN
ncbi:DUF4307 domain-containing protein [Ornithinimicrobium faecis]|uniref:DUF4307 domain-containing protein n=1 Tax=Ornithinimicrobium faecis TaxID=2934158 RepID=UPI00211797D3|nr:DUF4307 domain-containing protein [Ornithinimicrobium sp. HY1745]